MNKTSVAVAVAALLSVGPSTTVWADSQSTNQGPAMDSNTLTQSTALHNTALIQSANYVDKEIVASNGDSVGKIDKLVTNNRDHAVYAVVDVGGFLGIGVTDVAIPINKLQVRDNKWGLSSGITKNLLKKKMKYEESEFSAFEAADEPSGN